MGSVERVAIRRELEDFAVVRSGEAESTRANRDCLICANGDVSRNETAVSAERDSIIFHERNFISDIVVSERRSRAGIAAVIHEASFSIWTGETCSRERVVAEASNRVIASRREAISEGEFVAAADRNASTVVQAADEPCAFIGYGYRLRCGISCEAVSEGLTRRKHSEGRSRIVAAERKYNVICSLLVEDHAAVAVVNIAVAICARTADCRSLIAVGVVGADAGVSGRIGQFRQAGDIQRVCLLTGRCGLQHESLGAVASQAIEVEVAKVEGELAGCLIDGNLLRIGEIRCPSKGDRNRAIATDYAELVRVNLLVVGHDGRAFAQKVTCRAGTFDVEANVIGTEVLTSAYGICRDSVAILSQLVAVGLEYDLASAREAVAKRACSYGDCLVICSAEGDIVSRQAPQVNRVSIGGIEFKGSVLGVVSERLSVCLVAVDACAFALISTVREGGYSLYVGGCRHAVAECERVTTRVDYEFCAVSGVGIVERRGSNLDLVAVVDSDKACVFRTQRQVAGAVEDNRLLLAVVGDLFVIAKRIASFICALRGELVVAEGGSVAFACCRIQTGTECQLVARHVAGKAEGCAAVKCGGFSIESVFGDIYGFVAVRAADRDSTRCQFVGGDVERETAAGIELDNINGIAPNSRTRAGLRVEARLEAHARARVGVISERSRADIVVARFLDAVAEFERVAVACEFEDCARFCRRAGCQVECAFIHGDDAGCFGDSSRNRTSLVSKGDGASHVEEDVRAGGDVGYGGYTVGVIQLEAVFGRGVCRCPSVGREGFVRGADSPSSSRAGSRIV